MIREESFISWKSAHNKNMIIASVREQHQKIRTIRLFDKFFRDVTPMSEIKLAVVQTKPASVVQIINLTHVEIQSELIDISKLEGVKNIVDSIKI